MVSTLSRPRVWLAAGLGAERGEPADHPNLCDDQARIWSFGTDGLYHHGRHHATFAELHNRTDLREIEHQ